MISICTRVSFSNKTNFAYRIPLSASCFCKNHIVVHSWDTSVATRHMLCCPRTTFGQGCTATSPASSQDAQHVSKLSQLPTLMAYILLCQFHMFLGPTLAWILYLVSLKLKTTKIQYLWLLIDSQKWLISYHATERTMLHTLPICSFRKLFAYMVCQSQLYRIETPIL